MTRLLQGDADEAVVPAAMVTVGVSGICGWGYYPGATVELSVFIMHAVPQHCMGYTWKQKGFKVWRMQVTVGRKQR